MGKQHAPAPRKRATKARKNRAWHLPHLMVAAGILVALVASVPVGAYLKASVLVAQDTGTCPNGETGTPPNCSGAQQQQMTSCPDGSQVPQGSQCPQPAVCPTGMTGTPPNCMAPAAQVCQPPATGVFPNCVAPVVQTACLPPMIGTPPNCITPPVGNTGNTVQCPGETIPMHPVGYMCSGANTGAMSETQMQAGCINAGGQWMGMTAMPSCKMPGMQTGTVPTIQSCSNMGMGWDAANSRCIQSTSNQNMQPCPAGVFPTAANPCTQSGAMTEAQMQAGCVAANGQWMGMTAMPPCKMPGMQTGTVPTIQSCSNMGMGWDAANSRCIQSTTTQTFWCQNLNRMATSAECSTSRPNTNMNQQFQGTMPPCPTFTTPSGAATTTAPCGPMNFQPFMPFQPFNQMGKEGEQNQQVEPVDYNKAYQQQGPFKNFDYNNAFDQFKVNLDQNYTGKVGKNDVKRLQKLGTQVLSEVTRMQKEEDRSIKRAGGLTTCPPIATAQAALASVKAIGDLLKNTTETNVTESLAAEQQLGFGGGNQGFGGPQGGGFGGGNQGFGGPQGGGFGQPSFGPQSSANYFVAQAFGDMNSQNSSQNDTLWMKAMQAHGQTFMCEGLAHLQKETDRFIKEIKSVEKQVKDANLLAKFVALETKVTSDSNIANVNFTDIQPGDDPMADIMMAIQDDRMEFEDLRQEAMQAGEQGKICDKVTQASTMLPGFKDSLSEEEYAQAQDLVSSGLDACTSGDTEMARSILEQLFSLGNGSSGDIVNVDTKQFSKDQAQKFAGDLTAKQLAALTARLDDLTAQLTAANTQIALLSGQIADFATSFAKTAAPTAETKTVFNTIAQLPDAAQTKIIDNIQSVLTAAGDASKILFDEVQLSANTKAQFDALVNKIVSVGLTADAQTAIIAELDKVTALAQTETDKKVVESEVKLFMTNAGKLIDGIKPADRVKDGIAPGTDVIDMKQWFFAPTIEAKARGFVTGNPDGTLTPGKQMNGAEMACMGARAVLGADAIAAASEASIPGIAGPGWANKCLNALIDSGVAKIDDMKNVFNGSLATPVARKDAAEFIFDIKGDVIPTAGTTVTGVADAAKTAADTVKEQTAFAALYADGIMTGKDCNGEKCAALGDTLLKAEGITLFNRTLDKTTADCFDSSNKDRFASAECTAARALVNDNKQATSTK